MIHFPNILAKGVINLEPTFHDKLSLVRVEKCVQTQENPMQTVDVMCKPMVQGTAIILNSSYGLLLKLFDNAKKTVN